jgi:hypothetical protein
VGLVHGSGRRARSALQQPHPVHAGLQPRVEQRHPGADARPGLLARTADSRPQAGVPQAALPPREVLHPHAGQDSERKSTARFVAALDLSTEDADNLCRSTDARPC